MNSFVSFSLPRFVVAWVATVSVGGSVFGLPASVRIVGGFTETEGVLTSSASGESRLATLSPLAPGYYVFTAEYRTEGFDPHGKFAMDVKTPDRSANLSNYEWVGASPDWTPASCYFRVSAEASAQFRFGDWKSAQPNARLQLRNVAVEPFDFAKMQGVDWLQAEGFDAGQAGCMAPNWYLHNDAGMVSRTSLIPNTSYRTGRNVLRLVGNADRPLEMRHHCLPLPTDGELVLSLRARADQPVPLTMHLIQDGWGKRVEKRYAMTTSWQKYEAAWPVPTTREKDWFFLRLDVPKGDVPVEIADIRLEWKPTAPVADVDSYASAMAKGWQGAPGANLLYNPDFELGGAGFFYDFSWPKQYGQYAGIRRAKPIELLPGQVVDHGTCALIQGTSLRAYCFPVTVGRTYTVSADLRVPEGMAETSCKVWAFDSEWKCGFGATLDKLTEHAWKRYHWTFVWKPDNIQKRAYVRFDSPGILIDRIQVVEGTEAEYQAPPVMLGLVFDRWPYFVRGRDAAKAVIKVVPGVRKPGSAVVKVVASDAWGREVWNRVFDAPLDKVTEIPVDLPTDRLGVFHLDLKAMVGKDLAGIGIGRYAVLDPPYLQPRKAGHPGLAGICQESFNFPVWLCRDHATIQTDLGIRFNRFFAPIPSDLPDPIPQEWIDDLKAKCRPFREAGVDVMPCVELIPESAAKASQNLEMPTAEALKAYEEHLGAYVSAIKDEVTYYEIFNEPNLWRMPAGPDAGKRTMFPLKYLEFQKVAYRVIKGIDPKLQVVAPGLNNVDFDWIDTWMKGGAGKYMDIFSFHPYSETDFFPQGTRLESTMQGFGFTGPLVNSEKYFGANLFYDRAGYEETRRGYYLPHDGEFKTAGRSIQHFVSSVAVGIPVCFFNPMGTLSRRGPEQELFLYDFFGAYSAAIRLVATAGRGERIELGPTATAIVFPGAPDGPLVALWTPMLNVEGSLQLTGDFTAYDIMGNVVSPEQRKSGVRVATDPSYVRFKPGTSLDAIRQALLAADLFGMGDPFKVSLSVGGGRRLSIRVASQRNKPLDGMVRIVKVPEGWSLPSAKAFANLQATQTARLDFDLGDAVFKSMAEYPVSVVVESGEEFVRVDSVIRPLFAHAGTQIVADGELNDWAGAEWIALGEENLSTDFNPDLKHGGADDLSARLAVSWTAEALALAVVVQDDVFKPEASPALAWKGDSLQVYFDPLGDAMAEKANSQDDVEYLVGLIGGESVAWLAKGSEGNYRGEANKVEGFRDVDAQCKVVRKGTTTVYELVLPRKTCLPGLALEVDSACGFSVLINDNDGAGRKVGLTLAPRGMEPYGAPHLHRNLIPGQ